MKNDLKDLLTAIKDGMQNDLNAKIDDFIYWCYQVYINSYNVNNKTEEINNIRNFIEKVAVYSEFKYPNDIVNEIIPYSNSVNKKSSGIMNDTSITDFLNRKELKYLEKASYPRYVKLYSKDNKNVNTVSTLHLNSKGRIVQIDNWNSIMSKYNNLNIDFTNNYLKDVVDPVCDLFRIKNSAELRRIITNYENKKYFSEEIANCILYRIIERGGKYIGPRRALLTARELGMNIDIPMIYGYDSSDRYFGKLIANYLSFGGNMKLECYVNYMDKEQWLVKKMSIINILKQMLNIRIFKNDDIHSLITYYAKLGEDSCIFDKKYPRLVCQGYYTCYDCIMANWSKDPNLGQTIMIRLANNIDIKSVNKKKVKTK